MTACHRLSEAAVISRFAPMPNVPALIPEREVPRFAEIWDLIPAAQLSAHSSGKPARRKPILSVFSQSAQC
jgi:hypothetical protein